MEENVEVGYTCGGKRNEQVEVNSDPGFWEFHQKGVGGGQLSGRLGGRNDNEENVEVVSTGGNKGEQMSGGEQ